MTREREVGQIHNGLALGFLAAIVGLLLLFALNLQQELDHQARIQRALSGADVSLSLE